MAQDTFILMILLINISLGYVRAKTYSKCYGESIDDTLCTDGTTISIVDASYADVGLQITYTCENSLTITDSTCMVNIKEHDNVYFQEIKQKCEGKQACEDLTASKISSIECNNNLGNFETDYVVLVYVCVHDAKTTSGHSYTETTTVSTKTPKSSTPFDDVDFTLQGDKLNKPVLEETSNDFTLVVSLSVSCVLLAIVIAILVWILRRRQTKLIRQRSSAKNTANDITGPTPDPNGNVEDCSIQHDDIYYSEVQTGTNNIPTSQPFERISNGSFKGGHCQTLSKLDQDEVYYSGMVLVDNDKYISSDEYQGQGRDFVPGLEDGNLDTVLVDNEIYEGQSNEDEEYSEIHLDENSENRLHSVQTQVRGKDRGDALLQPIICDDHKTENEYYEI